MRILITDDDPELTRAFARALRMYEVSAFNNAAIALDLIANGARFDLILSDLVMAPMSGIAFYQALLEVSAEQAAKVVFVSGSLDHWAAREFLSSIPNPTLEKPVDLAELLSFVRATLDDR